MSRLSALLIALAVFAAGLVPASAEVSAAGNGAHACCRTVQATPMPGSCHAAAMRCCTSEPRREREPAGVPVSAPAQHAPELVLLKGFAAHAPAALAPASAMLAHPFVSARASAPPDPLYLRHLVLLV